MSRPSCLNDLRSVRVRTGVIATSEVLVIVIAMVWSQTDWVAPSERRRIEVTTVATLATLAISTAFYVTGLLTIDSPTGLVVTLVGFLLLVATAIAAPFIAPYRRIDSAESPVTAFHISPARWEVGDVVTLEVARAKRKQSITERWWPRRARMVYFFPQRPTHKQAKGQTLIGPHRRSRYLYEIELQRPVKELYRRCAAMGSTNDVTVVVASREELPEDWRKRRD